jgi:hypothetical protein
MTTNAADILSLVRTLPQKTQTVRITSPRRSSENVFTGALLMDYVRAAKMLPKERSTGGFANWYFVAAAEDGMTVAVAYAEIANGFSGKAVMLATEQDGEPIRAGLRLVVPGDYLGGRSIAGVASIEARSVERHDKEHDEDGEHEHETVVSDGVEITGDIERPGVVSLDALRALPAIDVPTKLARSHGGVMRPARTFGGPRIWDMLDDAGIILNPDIHEHILRKVIIARSIDGYAVAIAAAELEPRFQNADVIAGISEGNTPLCPEDGNIRLTVGPDKSIARNLKALASLELREG